jgi:dipeptidyl aminopeptidase/acylaminoacyl peptidase
LAGVVDAQRSTGVWSPEMQTRVKAIGTPRVSPDASRVVYTISDEVMTADKSEYVTQIWLGSGSAKDSVQLTFADKSSTNPRWSPDGQWIAFTSTRKDNKSNLYVMRVAGGEAEALTDVKSGVTDFDWSPDGRWIAFTMADPKSDEEEKNDKGRNDYRWVDENIKMSALYLVSLRKDEAGKREPRRLTAGNSSVSGFGWSPDGGKIVFSHVRDPRADFWVTSDVSVCEIATGHVRPFATTAAAETSPTYSPDGKWIAMVVSDNPPRWAQSGSINIFPAAGGTPRVMPASYDGQPNIVGWSVDAAKLYFTERKGTGTSRYYADLAKGIIVEDDSAPAAVTGTSINRTGNAFGLVMERTDRPPEAYIAKIGAPRPTQVSRANEDLARMPVGRTELIKWKSKDGQEVEGLLTYPVGYTSGTRVPLILNVHGGPAGAFSQSYIGARGVYPLATFAARGYAILRGNPRGSSGYGTEFRRANFKDWGGMDYQDLMTGVDKVIDMGVADSNRLGVMGWSYGGYMTSWIVTQTKRFKAASAGAPVTNLMSFNGTADIPAFVPDYFGGQSWEIPEVYAKHSAMFNVKGVTTPTLIEQGDADVRVPISQGYEFYNALKQQGVPTRMIVLPRQPHGPTEPKMQIAAMQANLDWFEKYLR